MMERLLSLLGRWLGRPGMATLPFDHALVHRLPDADGPRHTVVYADGCMVEPMTDGRDGWIFTPYRLLDGTSWTSNR